MFKKIVDKVSTMGFKKLGFILIVTLALMSTGAMAIWTLITSSSFTANVVSTDQAPVSFTSTFTSGQINTSNASVVQNFTSELYNANGNITMMFNAAVVKEDADDSCTDYENDCSNTYFKDGFEMNVSDTLNFTGGESTEVTTTIMCVQFSCPGNITTTISFNATA